MCTSSQRLRPWGARPEGALRKAPNLAVSGGDDGCYRPEFEIYVRLRRPGGGGKTEHHHAPAAFLVRPFIYKHLPYWNYHDRVTFCILLGRYP